MNTRSNGRRNSVLLRLDSGSKVRLFLRVNLFQY
ncbi:unnamed protein product [Schistosoma mattheei]|uniref:Uncharacterized protein n=2 Tax=Schistosoma TaxID=6181 RepID=A0A183K851_9TREM|nr:unnamed protein product [Schistosoma curassoni]VDP70455.1 unnamed protein product [Schistosoma mattheei]